METRGDNNRTAKIIKPAKVPTWTKSLSLETYTKQIETWSQLNKDVPENTKYQDVIESSKTNKEVKNLPNFVGENVLTVLKGVTDKTTKQVLDILKIKYGRSRMEKVKECIKNCLNFKENEYKEEDKFFLVMEKLDLREELDISHEEWKSVRMLQMTRKRKSVEMFQYQALRDVVKAG